MGRRAENARRLILCLYERPAVSVDGVMKALGINKNPARDLIKAMEDQDILEEMTGFRRNRIFVFRKYLDIFHGYNDL
jgi:hypothetical protein